MPEAPSPCLGSLDFPTREIALRRIHRINAGCLQLQVEQTRCGLRVRFPKPIRVCSCVRWSGNFFNRSDENLQPADVMRMITFAAATPKNRTKALRKLARIEKWVFDRLKGVDRHATHVREQQGVWIDRLNSEVAMAVLVDDQTKINDPPF